MMRAGSFVALWLLIRGVVPAPPQVTPALPYLGGHSEAEIVASAEREAGVFAADSRPPLRLKKLFTDERMVGTSERKCVAGSGLGRIRSGEFVIGGELSGPELVGRGVDETKKRDVPKIWWSPLHHRAEMELLVRARRVGLPEEYRFLGKTVAWGTAGAGQVVPENEREYFFPSGIEFLRAGKWIIVATQGSDWGCFILTLPQPAALGARTG